MNINKTVLVLFAAISSSYAHLLYAENSAYSMPPPGPYSSVADVDQYNFKHNDQTNLQLNKDAPEWVNQRRVEMQRQIQRSMPPVQAWNNQQPQQNYNQLPPMMNSGTYPGQRNSAGPYQYMGAYPAPNMAPYFQDNRMQQFPYAGNPVYGRTPPPEYYRQPTYPVSGY